MSRFNRNGMNLSSKQEDEWLQANSTTGEPESKAKEDEGTTHSDDEATNKQPDEGEPKTEETKKARRGLRRNKKKEDESNG